MLPPWIIEELERARREREERQQPALRVDLPEDPPAHERPEAEERPRGGTVIVIEL